MNKTLLGLAVNIILLVTMSGAIIFYNLGQGSLWDWDEAIYASVAKEMVQDGNGLSLHLNGHYWPEKPPLMIWCMAAAYKTLGVNELSARLPAAIFGWLSVLLVYWIGVRLFNHWAGLLSGIFLATNWHFLLLSRMAMLDVPLLFFISASLWFYWLGREKPWYFLLAGLCMGLGVMTKSLVGFFPLPIILLHLLISPLTPNCKPSWLWLMMLAAVMVAGPWHVQQMIAHGRAFSDYYFGYNLFLRVATVLEGHGGSPAYYLKYVCEHFFTPWLVLSLLVLFAFGPELIRRFKTDRNDPIFFLLLWFLTLVVFFALARTKIVGYIVPSYLPLALITAKLSLDHLPRLWFKTVFFIFLAATVAQAVLFHPLRLVIIDKSPEVKQLAAAVPTNHQTLIVYRLPPNAPTFYFNAHILGADSEAQLNEMLTQVNEAYLLCQEQDRRLVRTTLDNHNIPIADAKQNREIAILRISSK